MATVSDQLREMNSSVSAELAIRRGAVKSIFSIDVEDWFHILDVPGTPDLEEWDSLPSLVEKNFHKLLDLFAEKNVRVTCFFLGWVAKKFPQLVREAAARGHEIASHGFAHRLVYTMTPNEFMQDLVLSKGILESMLGKPILGYRTSGFSVTDKTPWFFEKIVQAGYLYDSSVFPGPRQHGGMKSDKLGPYYIGTDSGRLLEFPITVTKVGGRPLCFFGGGYLRLAPYPVIRNMARKVLGEKRPVIFYIHPREIDPNHPRLSMSAARRFKSYVNLRTTEEKIRRLVTDFPVTTFEDFIQHNNQAENENV
jgi:polysaccharide deacetylase family protein (PEP-CTERM system associated)